MRKSKVMKCLCIGTHSLGALRTSSCHRKKFKLHKRDVAQSIVTPIALFHSLPTTRNEWDHPRPSNYQPICRMATDAEIHWTDLDWKHGPDGSVIESQTNYYCFKPLSFVVVAVVCFWRGEIVVQQELILYKPQRLEVKSRVKKQNPVKDNKGKAQKNRRQDKKKTLNDKNKILIIIISIVTIKKWKWTKDTAKNQKLLDWIFLFFKISICDVL